VSRPQRWTASIFRLMGLSVTRAVLSLLLVLAVGIIFNADGAFLQWDTHRDMLRQVSVFGILACGVTLVIITGGIDLSVGSILGLCAVLFSLFSIHQGWSWPGAILVTLAAGTLLGAVSGGLIARFRMQPFIATLAMMVFARGLAKFASGGQKISTAVQQASGAYEYVSVPPIFDIIGARIAADNLAVVTLILGLSILLCWVLLERTPWGVRCTPSEETRRPPAIPGFRSVPRRFWPTA
jgi:ribose transport system permease protein